MLLLHDCLLIDAYGMSAIRPLPYAGQDLVLWAERQTRTRLLTRKHSRHGEWSMRDSGRVCASSTVCQPISQAVKVRQRSWEMQVLVADSDKAAAQQLVQEATEPRRRVQDQRPKKKRLGKRSRGIGFAALARLATMLAPPLQIAECVPNVVEVLTAPDTREDTTRGVILHLSFCCIARLLSQLRICGLLAAHVRASKHMCTQQSISC
jgi:hypothetical protein